MSLFDLVGIVGVATVLASYLLLQMERLDPKELPYICMNLFGSLGIIVSLTRHFNFSSFLIESCWVAISLYGLVRWAWKKYGSTDRV